VEYHVASLVDALPDIVWTALPDGDFDFLNQPWSDYTGLGDDTAHGQSWQAAIHPADLAGLLDRWRAIVASADRGDMQVRIRRFDGEYRQFLFRARPITDPCGQVVKWCGMAIDIEDQRQSADEALRASESHFRTIVDSIPAHMVVMTPAGEVEAINRQFLEYIGETLEDVKSQALGESTHPDERPKAIRAWWQSVATGEPFDAEYRVRRTDGVYRWFHVRALPDKNADGRVRRWYVLQTDVDDRRRAEALLAGEKQLLEMVAGGTSMPEILEALCHLVESTAGGCYCGVVLLDSSGTRLELGAAPSLPNTFITSVLGRAVHVESGPSAMAAYLNEQVIAPDLTSETRWVTSGWCAMALRHGLRACWSTPFTSSAGKVLGVIAIYYDEPKVPTPLQQHLLEQFTHIASIAVERAQTDAALKRSEARKGAILDSALDCIVTIDHEGCITEFNPTAELTFGYTRDQVLGQQLADVVIPPSLREEHRRGLARYLATGEAAILGRRIEMRAMRADGSEFSAELAITRIPVDGPPSFTGYVRDITERKQSVDERNRAQAQLAGEKRLLEMVASGYSLPDILNALCSFVENTATECSCGVYLIDWSGPTFHYAAAPSVPATFYEPIDGAVLRDEIGPCAIAVRLKTQVIAADIESDVQWKDSAFRTLALANGIKSCWSTPIYSLAGAVLGTFALYQRTPARPTPVQLDLIAQVTHIASIAIERTQGEAALRRSEAFLAHAQRLSSTGSFLWRLATDEVTFSEQAKRIFEFDQAERVTLEMIRSRVHPEDRAMLSELIALDRRDVRDDDHEIRLQMPDHSIKYLHSIAQGTRDQDGQLEYFGAIQDVTERRLSEEALANARSELTRVARVTSLGALTASIAHEVNQPLSGIITNASTCLRMLGADPPNVDGARETARRTIRDGNRASEVISRLRALFTNRRTAAESVDLNEATQEVIALLRSELQSNRVSLRTELADDLPPLTADRVQLQQVIVNLLLNASDAMTGVEDRPRQLVVSTERDGGSHVRLTVQDAGVGLDPQSLDKLFDAFYTTKAGGMGIGLSVSRSIIERHHGHLWAAPNDGPGATFAFSIPEGSGSVAGADSTGEMSSAAGIGVTHGAVNT